MELNFHSALGPYEKQRIVVGLTPYDRCVMALQKLFEPSSLPPEIPAFKSLVEAYTTLTGDDEISCMFKPNKVSKDLRSCQEFNSTTFSYALANAMNVYLSKCYKDFPLREERLISQKKPVTDFRQIDAVQLGYFGELPDVNPESEDYKSMEPFVDSTSQYRLSQKGAIVWVTRRHIVNDNIGVVKDIVKRLSRAARIAHAKYVWSFFISNKTCPDGTAWFTPEHGNLATDVLDIAPLVAAIKALANMTETQPSAEKLGLDLATFNWNLVVALNAWDNAVKLNQNEYVYTSNDLTTKQPNPCLKLFGEKNERIITCPFFASDNDWGVIRDVADVPIVEMSYLNGREEPELITSYGPRSEGMFTFRDEKLGYKLRHEYGGTLADYKGAFKAII